MSDNYDDIINLLHHTSKTHPRMSAIDRAAQFSPFAALTGYEAVVKETARLTEGRPELTEDEKSEVDARLRLVMELDAEVSVTWFRPDSKKSGGSYVTVNGRIRKVDELQQTIVMEDGTSIPINEITAIDSQMFNYME